MKLRSIKINAYYEYEIHVIDIISFLEKFKENLSSIVYETWFSETELFDLNNNTAKIKVPTHVHKKYLKFYHYYNLYVVEKQIYKNNLICKLL